MTREDYLKLFDSQTEAINFENHFLSSGSSLLTPEAVQVRDGTVTEPSSAYWDFLAAQVPAYLDYLEAQELSELT